MKKFKFFILLSALLLTFCVVFSACRDTEQNTNDNQSPPQQSTQNQPNDNDNEETKDMTDEIYFTIGGNKIEVKLENNAAVEALIKLLNEGDITYTASEYGGFEKVGALGHTLPRNDVQLTTEAGDVVLYSGNQIVIFFGSNSWSYTKLGTVQGVSKEQLRDILTASDPVTITISLK